MTERLSKYDAQHIVDFFPPLTSFGNHIVWCGSFSRTIPTMRQRYILKASLIKDPGLDFVMTPTDAARSYLDYKFPKQLRATRAQIEHWQPRRHQPMLAFPGQYRDMIYLDLKSAYWSILQVVGWDCEYFPSMIVRGGDVSDFPYPKNKIARNSLVSLGLPSPTFVYQGGSIKEMQSKKRINLGLWSLVQDILAAIAGEMWDEGAVYVNTDGYILPASKERIAIERIAQWGLLAEVKHRGNARIYGVGVYSIGSHQTRNTAKLASGTIDINSVNTSVLRDEFGWLASRFPPQY